MSSYRLTFWNTINTVQHPFWLKLTDIWQRLNETLICFSDYDKAATRSTTLSRLPSADKRSLHRLLERNPATSLGEMKVISSRRDGYSGTNTARLPSSRTRLQYCSFDQWPTRQQSAVACMLRDIVIVLVAGRAIRSVTASVTSAATTTNYRYRRRSATQRQ